MSDEKPSAPTDEPWWPLEWRETKHYRETAGVMVCYPTLHPLVKRIVRRSNSTNFDELFDKPTNLTPTHRISAYYAVLTIDEADDLSIRAALLTLADPFYPRSNPHGTQAKKEG